MSVTVNLMPDNEGSGVVVEMALDESDNTSRNSFLDILKFMAPPFFYYLFTVILINIILLIIVENCRKQLIYNFILTFLIVENIVEKLFDPTFDLIDCL